MKSKGRVARKADALCRPPFGKAEGWTQAQIGTVMGVARNTVSDWLGINNVGADKANNAPDSRTKVPRDRRFW